MGTDATRATIALAVDPADGTISGEISKQGERRSFQGWLELINELETWRAHALAVPEPPDDHA